MAHGELFAAAACPRAVVYYKVHRHGGLVDLDQIQRFRRVGIGNGFADLHVGVAGKKHDLSGRGFLDLDALEPRVDKYASDWEIVLGAIALQDGDGFGPAERCREESCRRRAVPGDRRNPGS